MTSEILNSFSLSLDFLRDLVSDVPDEQMTAQPAGAMNHPACVIGHLAYSCQALGGELGLAPWLPKDWSERFGTGSTPSANRAAYPAKAEMSASLADAQRRIAAAVSAAPKSVLAAPLPDERYRDRFPTLGHAVIHILGAHAALHVGQITVWRRVMGFGRSASELI